MRSRFLRATGSMLGLLAILLIALVPVFSHALAQAHEADGEFGMHCSMPSMQHAPQHTSQHDHANAHGTLLHLDACGYCSLLAHMPAIVAPPVAFASVVLAVMHAAATRFESVRLIEPLRPGQARAPPLLFS